MSGGKLWLVAMAALGSSACQLISGLDDLEADRKPTDSLEAADSGPDSAASDASLDSGAADAASGGSSGKPAAGSGGRAAAGAGAAAGAPVAGSSGAGGMSGAGAGAAPAECKPPVSGGLCDPVAQCGCGTAENCVFYQGKLACVSEGTTPPYGSCSRDNDCTKGHICAGGACEKACSNAADTSCPGDGARCRQIGFEGVPVSGAYTCTRSCNPAHPQLEDARFDACGADLNCTSAGDHSECVQATAAGTSGTSCQGDGDCASGFYCSTLNLCEKWCEVGTDDCGSGAMCAAFASKTYAGKSIEFGGCCTPPAGKGPCDTSPQCGCPATQRCDFVVGADQPDGTTACVPIGPVEGFKTCASHGDCGRGYSCIDDMCQLLCDLTRPSSCLIYSQYSTCAAVAVSGIEVPGWGVCTQVCNPAVPFAVDKRFTPCVEGTTCRHLGDGQTDCRRILDPTAAVGTQGSACADAAGAADGLKCATGHFCDSTGLTCMQYCEMGAAGACANGLTCHSFDPAIHVSTIELGFCR